MDKSLEKIIGLPVKSTPFQGGDELPMYLMMRKLYLVTVGGVGFLLVNLPAKDSANVRSLGKQMYTYQKSTGENVVFSIEGISKRQRAVMIENKIPFISLPNQVYLPFAGILLQEEFKNLNSVKVDRLTPASQMLLLLLLERKQERGMTKGEAAKRLKLTATSITRASNQLHQLGATKEERIGQERRMICPHSRKKCMEMMGEYLISPVKEVIYSRTTKEISELPDGGETALARKSMLNPPKNPEKACYKEDGFLLGVERLDPQLDDISHAVRLEVWKYDPALFSKRNVVDPISLYCSLRDNEDERIQGALEEMMEGYYAGDGDGII